MRSQISSTIGVNISTTTTIVLGVEPGLYKLASRVATAMPVVLDGSTSGVGVVVSSKGYVLVPTSLVTDPDDISVVIGGQQLVATLVGADTGTGLAVVRVHDPDTLTATRFVSGATAGIRLVRGTRLGRQRRAPHVLGNESVRWTSPADFHKQQPASPRVRWKRSIRSWEWRPAVSSSTAPDA